MADVFISYASSDREHRDTVESWLTSRGYTVWSDQQLSAGQSFRSAIREAISNARCIIVIWTPTSVLSAFVEDEAAEAQHANRLVPVAVAGLDLRRIPMGFRGLQTLRLSNIDQLSSALQRLGIEPAAGAPGAPVDKPSKRLDTIGAIIERMNRMKKLRITIGAVAVPLAVVLLIAFPSAMLAILLAAAVVIIVMLYVTA
jgi:hypothetical protein